MDPICDEHTFACIAGIISLEMRLRRRQPNREFHAAGDRGPSSPRSNAPQCRRQYAICCASRRSIPAAAASSAVSNDAGNPAGKSAPRPPGSERHRALDLDERAAVDDPAAAATRTAGPEHTHLVLVRQHDLELEPLVREQAGEAHEPGEHVLEPAVLRRAARRQHVAVVGEAHDPARQRHRRDEPDAVRAEQRIELAAQRREVARLDLDQELGPARDRRRSPPTFCSARSPGRAYHSLELACSAPSFSVPIIPPGSSAGGLGLQSSPRRRRSSRASVSGSSLSRRSPRARSTCSGRTSSARNFRDESFRTCGARRSPYRLVRRDDRHLLDAPVLGREPLERASASGAHRTERGRALGRRRGRRRRGSPAPPWSRPSRREGRAARRATRSRPSGGG